MIDPKPTGAIRVTVLPLIRMRRRLTITQMYRLGVIVPFPLDGGTRPYHWRKQK